MTEMGEEIFIGRNMEGESKNMNGKGEPEQGHGGCYYVSDWMDMAQ